MRGACLLGSVVLAFAACAGPSQRASRPPTSEAQPSSGATSGAPSSGPQAAADAGSASGAPSLAAASPPTSERTLDDDAPLVTPQGGEVRAPAGWRVQQWADVLRVASPNEDVRVTFVDVPDAAPELAIAAAWKRAAPSFAGTVTARVAPPVKGGWDDVLQLEYMAGVEGAVALARRSGAVTYVVLVEGAKAVLERRAAQLNGLVLSLKVRGVAAESFAGRSAAPLEGPRRDAFAAFVEEARTALEVPGAAVAVVQNGTIVFARGFGVRGSGGGAAVTPSTLFRIGAVTKALTTLLVAKLVDEGTVTWDTLLVALEPTFAVGDTSLTAALRLRDAFSGASGLPGNDLEALFEHRGATAASRIAELRTSKPTTVLGETFQPNHTLFAAGGYLAAHAAKPRATLGDAYDALMTSRLFGPMGLRKTTFDPRRAHRSDVASPHAFALDGTVVRLDDAVEGSAEALRPAVGLWSSAEDLARWVQVELGEGVAPQGKTIVSKENVHARYEPQVTLHNQAAYGLGVTLSATYDLEAFGHDGATTGYGSRVVFYPKAKLGLVVLANSGQASTFSNAVGRRLLELVFDAKPEAMRLVKHTVESRALGIADTRQRLTVPPDPSWVTSLLGVYREPSLGRLEVRREGDAVVADAGEWASPLGQLRREAGTKSLTFLRPPVAGLELRPATENGATVLVLEAGARRYVFSRASP